jgi:hypothetical protein
MAGMLVTSSACGAEDCPEHFHKYGLFLQANKSCVEDTRYPLMNVMRSCAKETPQKIAIKLMDEGRREWARGVMRSSLGSMCEKILTQELSRAEKSH